MKRQEPNPNLDPVEVLKEARRLWEGWDSLLAAAKSRIGFVEDYGEDYGGERAICIVAPDGMCDWLCDIYESRGQDFDRAIAYVESLEESTARV